MKMEKMMVKHIILWKLKDEISDNASVKAGIKVGLEGLKGVVPGLVDIVVNNKNGSLSFFYDNCDNVLISHSFERLFPLKSISLERLGMPIIV